jgi:hypothetical protein
MNESPSPSSLHEKLAIAMVGMMCAYFFLKVLFF